MKIMYILEFAIIFFLIVTIHCKEKPTAESLWREADQEILNQHYKIAIRLYSDSLSIEPENINVLYKRAEANYLERNFRSAELDLSHIISVDPKHRDAYFLRGKIYLLTGRYQESINDFNEVLSLNPKHLQAQQKLKEAKEAFSILRKLNQALGLSEQSSSESKRDCRKALPLLTTLLAKYSRDHIDYRLKKIECGFEMKDQKMIRDEVNRIFALEPDNLQALYFYAKLMTVIGSSNAQQYLRKCLNKDPDNKNCRVLLKLIKNNEMLLEQAKGYLENGLKMKAVDKYKEYLKNNDENPYNVLEIQGKLCSLYKELRNTQEGLVWCSKIIESFQKNREEGVEENVDESSSSPSDILKDAFVNRSDIYIMLDDLDNAEKDIQAAMNKFSNDQTVRGQSQKLKNLRRQANRKDYYKILGVSKTATEKEIRKAYRKQAQIWHPDRHADAEKKKIADGKFKDIAEAKEVLLSPEKRERYDNGEDLNEQASPFQHGFNPFGFGGDSPGGHTFTFSFGGPGGQFRF